MLKLLKTYNENFKTHCYIFNHQLWRPCHWLMVNEWRLNFRLVHQFKSSALDTTRMGLWCRLVIYNGLFFGIYGISVYGITNHQSENIIHYSVCTECLLEFHILQSALNRFRTSRYYFAYHSGSRVFVYLHKTA